jgi:hypothetical protein
MPSAEEPLGDAADMRLAIDGVSTRGSVQHRLAVTMRQLDDNTTSPCSGAFRRAETTVLLLLVTVLLALLGAATIALVANRGRTEWAPTRPGWLILGAGLALLLAAGAVMTLRLPRNLFVAVILAAIALNGAVLCDVFLLEPWLLGVLACGAGVFAVATVINVSRSAAATPPSSSVAGSLWKVATVAGALCLNLLYGFPRWDVVILLVVAAGLCAVSAVARRRRVAWWPASVTVPVAVVAIADLVFALGASAQDGNLTALRALTAAAAVLLCAASLVMTWRRDASTSRGAVAVLACTVSIATGVLFAVGLLAAGFGVTTPIASVRSPDGVWTLSITDEDAGGLGGGMSVVFHRDYLGLVQQERTVDYDPPEFSERPRVHWLNASVVDIDGRLFSVSGKEQH